MKKIYVVLVTALLFATGCQKPKLKYEEPIKEPEVNKVATNLPVGAKDGVVFTNNGTTAIVTLYAPNKTSISLIGDFNNWSSTANPMIKANDDKTWFVTVNNLNANTEYSYQFLIDGNLKVADPYAEKILDEVNDKFISSITYPNLMGYPTGKTAGIVGVMQGNQPVYTWKNANFTRPAKNNLVIYELLIRDFTTAHTYASTLEKLDYLISLGINAIELMPVNEFEGNLSWGYNPSFYFAADKYYGTKTALQNFIDECHGKGIAIIVDVVLNHSFSQSPMVQMYFDNGKPTANNPWYNVDAKHPFNVGFDFNHESAATKYFSKNVMKFWMQQYKVDGFRFDLSKGFTQNPTTNDAGMRAYDASRVAIWKDYNDYIKSIDPNNFYVILEHFGDDAEEKVLSDEGMMLWGNLNHDMNEATMGWVPTSNLSRGLFTNRTFTKPDNLITYAESHDEQRLTYKNLMFGNISSNYAIKGNLATSLKRNEMAAAFLFAMPGPKMIWQFGEVGYDVDIDFNGRTGDKPIRWEYYTEPNRRTLFNAYAKFIRLKTKNTIFNSSTFTSSLAGGVKHLRLTEGNNIVIVVGNFDVTSQNANINFGAAGVWVDAVGNNISLSGNTYTATLAPGEYHIFSKTALIN